MTYTVQTRSFSTLHSGVRSFAILADAIAWGLSQRFEFDISTKSGAIVWAWEQRL